MSPSFECSQLSVRRPGSVVLSGAGFQLRDREILWIDGESGSGKSTLLRALACLLAFEAGSVTLDGVSYREFAPHEWRAKVGLSPHPPIALGATVGEELRAPYRLRVRRHEPPPSDRQIEAELEALGLEGIGLSRPTAELSQGQLARVAFLRTLSTRPRVLLLDEPTANLDPRAARLLAERVRAYTASGAVAVVAAHAEPWDGVTQWLRLAGGRLLEAAR